MKVFRRRWAAPKPARTMVNLGGNRILIETAAGHQVLAFADDLSATPALVRNGYHDVSFASFLSRELHAGDTVVDVGANIGLIALHAACIVTAAGRVLAFEPNPECFALLSDSFYLNRMQGRAMARLDLIEAAVGDEPGMVELHAPTRHRGRASLDPVNVPEDDRSIFTVERVVLDPILDDIPEIRLVKIDVEGAELEVLRGLRRTIDERRVRLLDLELHEHLAGSTWDELMALLHELAATATSTFTIALDGTRQPTTVAEAATIGRLSHFVLAFD